MSRYASITAIAHYVPPDRRDNAYFEERLRTNDDWIVQRTGIRERRIALNQSTSDLIVRAAQRVLRARKMSVEEIDCIVVATMSGDHPNPSTAAAVQRKLGVVNAWGFNIAAACSGFVYGLSVVSSLVTAGTARRVLFCCGEKMSSVVDQEDRAVAVLFGDGAAAMIIEATDDPAEAILDCCLALDGRGEQALYTPSGGSVRPIDAEALEARTQFLHLDGRTVFRSAVAGMSRMSRMLLSRHAGLATDMKYFVPHQANLRIIESVAQQLGIGMERVAVNIDKYGNTAAASIPICLSELHQHGLLNKGDAILATSFGAGYTMGSTYFRWGVPPCAEYVTLPHDDTVAPAREAHNKTSVLVI